MAHELTIRTDGTVEAAYSLKAAWHGLGQVIDHAMTSEDAMREAHLNWGVLQAPLRGLDMRPDPPVSIEIPDHVANIREDDGAVLGIVGKDYQIVQNAEAFSFLDALVPDGIVKYESAGSLKGGKRVWVLARMPETFDVAEGDKLEQYILMLTSHDGTRAVTVKPTSVRVVCQNTLDMSMAMGGRSLEVAGVGEDVLKQAKQMVLSIRHTKNAGKNVKTALGMVTSAQAAFDVYHSRAKRLAGIGFDTSRLQALTEILIPKEDGINDTYRAKVRAGIMGAFTDDPQNIASIRGTAWAAFNAVTQYVDHEARFHGEGRQRAENRMVSVTEGANARLKVQALDLIESAALATA